MLSDISSRLAQVVEQRRLKEKTERDLAEVQRSLKVKTEQLAALERQLKKEQVDVDRLAGLSLSGLFYSVLGSKDQQMEKERQELLAAELKYQQAKRMVDALRADQASLEQQFARLRGIDEEYAALLTQKAALLRQSNPQAAAELLRLTEESAERSSEKREIDEAVTAASAVLLSLDAVIAALESAEGWGTWDMLGGGLLSTAVKHSRIDEARDAVQDVQARMSRFTRELADVQRSTDVSIQIDGLDTFADFFFDGLIMDWIVQSKIQDSLDQSRQAHQRIARAVTDLEKLRVNVVGQMQRLNDQRAALIEKTVL